MQMQTNGLTYEVFHVVRKKSYEFWECPPFPAQDSQSSIWLMKIKREKGKIDSYFEFLIWKCSVLCKMSKGLEPEDYLTLQWHHAVKCQNSGHNFLKQVQTEIYI